MNNKIESTLEEIGNMPLASPSSSRVLPATDSTQIEPPALISKEGCTSMKSASQTGIEAFQQLLNIENNQVSVAESREIFDKAFKKLNSDLCN